MNVTCRRDQQCYRYTGTGYIHLRVLARKYWEATIFQFLMVTAYIILGIQKTFLAMLFSKGTYNRWGGSFLHHVTFTERTLLTGAIYR